MLLCYVSSIFIICVTFQQWLANVCHHDAMIYFHTVTKVREILQAGHLPRVQDFEGRKNEELYEDKKKQRKTECEKIFTLDKWQNLISSGCVRGWLGKGKFSSRSIQIPQHQKIWDFVFGICLKCKFPPPPMLSLTCKILPRENSAIMQRRKGTFSY